MDSNFSGDVVQLFLPARFSVLLADLKTGEWGLLFSLPQGPLC
jgi:hypothetical protein